MKRTLIAATRNAGKLREIHYAIGEWYDVQPCPEEVPEVEETANTYEGNARLKAEAVSQYINGIVISDDTGIEVDALSGGPGIYSARFSGPDVDTRRNCQKLVDQMSHVFDNGRRALYRTIAVARLPDGREVVAEGTCEGTIATALCGDGGFGYDPVFTPLEGDGRTFAEMTLEEKDNISHRAKAFRLLIRKLAATEGEYNHFSL